MIPVIIVPFAKVEVGGTLHPDVYLVAYGGSWGDCYDPGSWWRFDVNGIFAHQYKFFVVPGLVPETPKEHGPELLSFPGGGHDASD